MNSPTILRSATMEIFKLFEILKIASPTAKTIIIVIQFVVFLALTTWTIYGWFRNRHLRRDIEIAKQDGDRKTEKAVRNERAEFRQERERLEEKLSQLVATNATITTEIEHLERQINEMQTENAELETDRSNLQSRIVQLDKLDATVWSAKATNAPLFKEPSLRKTRFISFLNLKGGVGKTTLSSNFGVALGRGVLGDPKSVLLVDLDFQGSLSNTCVHRQFLNDRRRNQNTSDQLLAWEGEPEHLFSRLLAPMNDVENVRVIVARDDLDRKDFQQQAMFAINAIDVRFDYRRLFHSDYVFGEFDYVFFDCPPRLTASSINALLTSDHVVIPTNLVAFDVDAIARTLNVLGELRAIDEFHADVLAVVANEMYRQGTIDDATKHEEQALLRLRQSLKQFDLSEKTILHNVIPLKKNPIAYAALNGKPASTTIQGRELFQDAIVELCERMGETGIHRQTTAQ